MDPNVARSRNISEGITLAGALKASRTAQCVGQHPRLA
eukprot:CAMPEP_0202771658 /NCGR_PEP_ID=MMETSP1388-20130828/41205_1 /ASSEMBLY_ACC=CAM_ASM_000864 /TAXON_ID=37098 /ORGANISM="Isochrysis sp, Strain CCMP1244" /LENGTH=37 /DNA_ID= /DNA_START= /DNA_END= /DNA_ORIENTATION=